MFYDVHKENMFTTNIEDGREGPSKASLYIVSGNPCLFVCMFNHNSETPLTDLPTFLIEALVRNRVMFKNSLIELAEYFKESLVFQAK